MDIKATPPVHQQLRENLKQHKRKSVLNMLPIIFKALQRTHVTCSVIEDSSVLLTKYTAEISTEESLYILGVIPRSRPC